MRYAKQFSGNSHRHLGTVLKRFPCKFKCIKFLRLPKDSGKSDNLLSRNTATSRDFKFPNSLGRDESPLFAKCKTRKVAIESIDRDWMSIKEISRTLTLKRTEVTKVG